MRIAILFLTFLFLSTNCFASISTTPVQSVGQVSSTGSSVVITIANPAAGNNLYALCASANTTPTVTNITGGGVTWSVSPAISIATNKYASIWEGTNSSGAGTTVTVNFSGVVGANLDCWVVEFSGVSTSSSLDTTGSNSGNSATPSATLSPDPATGNNELMLFIEKRGGSYSSGPTNGFTRLAQGTANGASLAAYQVVSSTSGTYSTGFTVTISNVWAAVIASFKAAAGGSVANHQTAINNFFGKNFVLNK